MKPTVTTVVSVHMTGEEATELKRAILRISEAITELKLEENDSMRFGNTIKSAMATLSELRAILPQSSK